jgi:spermidine synthase
MHDIGIKYFGLKNYDKHGNRINWLFEDAQNCINKMNTTSHKDTKYENKIGFYDLIFNEINDISPKEDTTPPKSHFSDDFLNKVKKLMKPCGIFMVNVMSKNYKGLYEIYLQLEKHFPTSFVIPSENGLCLIFFCFKDNYDVEKYNKKFQKNKDIIEKNEIVEFAIVKPILTEVISRVKEMEDQKEKLKENSKKI